MKRSAKTGRVADCSLLFCKIKGILRQPGSKKTKQPTSLFFQAAGRFVGFF
jgi:hypothetical protein